MQAALEHVNYTVRDPDSTAAWMCDLFGWHVRWSGEAKNGGRTVHVGTESQYLALYAPPGEAQAATDDNYETAGGFNHVAILTDDLDATEHAVRALGFTPVNHGDYEPGRRFYFHDKDGIEYEMVQYD